jgi:pyruvate formate lyase activating enzyme
MIIRDFLKESYIDYPGKISTVVFTPSCNYICPACHARYILTSDKTIPEKSFFDYVDSARKWLDAVVISGGEPTLENGLFDFISQIKNRGLLVKLDTNGSNSQTLSKLKEQNLIDYVAMDIKSPPYLYSFTIGRKCNLEDIDKSIKTTSQFPDYEFRTTIAPIRKRPDSAQFLQPDEVEEIAKWIVEVTKTNNHKYYLQKFVPRKDELLDEELIRFFPETPNVLMENIKEKVIKHLPNTKIRN